MALLMNTENVTGMAMQLKIPHQVDGEPYRFPGSAFSAHVKVREKCLGQ